MRVRTASANLPMHDKFSTLKKGKTPSLRLLLNRVYLFAVRAVNKSCKLVSQCKLA